MHKLLERQLAKSKNAEGEVNLDGLLDYVSEAYEGLYLDQRRMDRSNTLMSDELEAVNAELIITAAHDAERNLWFEAALNNMTDGICLFDANRELLVSNDRFATIYGLDPEQIKPKLSFEDLLYLRIERGIYFGNSPEEYIEKYLGLAEQTERSVVVHTLNNGQQIEITQEPLQTGGFLSTHTDVTERLSAERKINKLAHFDTLTGLPNRSKIQSELRSAMEDARANNTPMALFCIDLNGFKEVNDTLGHPVGDMILIEVGKRLSAIADDNIVVGRLGGDEFLLVLRSFSDQAYLTELADLICDEIARDIQAKHNVVSISGSIGIAVGPSKEGEGNILIQNADLALYRAKKAEQCLYHFFDEKMNAEAKLRRRMITDMRNVVSTDELLLHYQPQIELQTNKIIGYEALLRWQHPELGMISPLSFITLAEETGVICDIGEWVLNTACDYAVLWPNKEKIAVNISPVQFKRQNVAEVVRRVLDRSGLEANRLDIEITESVLIQNKDTVIAAIDELSAMGVTVTLDDFGTGYSSLSYLSQFSFDKIKIDKSFIDEFGKNSEITTIVNMIIGLGRGLNTTIIAEGIEHLRQHELLRHAGCTQGQGYLYGRPESQILDVTQQTLQDYYAASSSAA